ncbi:hypothetical protein AAEJ42_23285, partial [Shewanella algae]|uniref:hypothetical protein n=1 Tax=Shewanella algae TaxID=38313 RepID=UPI00313C7C08
SAGFALRALAGAARTQNPILEHPGLQQRLVQLRAVASGEAGGLAPIDGWPDAGLSGQHRLQAQALRYALALALSDVQAIIA